MNHEINWTVVGTIFTALAAIATAFMTWATFKMANKAKQSLDFQGEQLKYQYAPTFIIENEARTVGSLPSFRIRNKGNGMAYDNTIRLILLNDGYERNVYEENVSYIPNNPIVQYDLNAQDSVKIEMNNLRGFTCNKQDMRGTESTEYNLKIELLYTDQLHQKYKAYCLLKIFYNKDKNDFETDFANGRVLAFEKI